jgi:predicted ATP-grasp superfamily ATP-dependent carboligase
LTAGTVLIAALSGRGLAASARRAGYLPLVADAFGDSDTTDLAAAARRVTDAARIGFRAKPVFSALAELEAAAPSPPIGLVLGSGFEDRPKLIAALSRRYRLIGNGAETIARTKNPAGFFALLDTLGIAHPATQLTPPADMAGWLSKRVGGSGGTHVVDAAAADRSPRRYYQRRLDGVPHSVLAVATVDGMHIVGISRQWSVGGGPRPFRYGGAVGPVQLPPVVDAAMRAGAARVSSALGLIGLVAFDFLLVGDVPFLIEVNPRPGATLDVFDDAHGGLFRAHVDTCSGKTPCLPTPDGARAAAILYADPGPLTIGAVRWPEWTADRPPPATRVPRYRPIATVFAAAEARETAFESCRRRLDELAEMLYAQAPNRERSDNAEVQRPRPERFRARSEAR